MNCKPGDLAYIVGSSKFAGRIVEVVSHAPQDVPFALPDGYMQSPTNYEWVIRFVGAPIEAPVTLGTRVTRYGAAPDRLLRPISGVPVNEEVPNEIKEPA